MSRADIGIDLGTSNVIVYIGDKGIVLDEPSVIAVDARTNNIISVGKDARKMLGKTPKNIKVIRPIRKGIIADYAMAETMLKYFINKVIEKKGIGIFLMPRIMVCVPSGLTAIEKKAVEEATRQAGAREVYIIEEPIAAAVGAGIDISEATGSMIIDIGGGTTDIAVISLGGTVISESIKVAGDKFDEDILKYIKAKYNLVIGDRTAEKVKLEIANVYEDEEKSIIIRGVDIITRLPKAIKINCYETKEALEESVNQIIELSNRVLGKTPPELIADIAEKGIIMTGGGCLLKGLAKRIEDKLGIEVKIADNPTICVAKGTGETLNSLDILENATGKIR